MKQSSPSLGALLGFLALFGCMIAVSLLARRGPRKPAEPPPPGTDGGWTVFKDRTLSFEHPADWRVLPPSDPDAPREDWGIVPPEMSGGKSWWGVVSIERHPPGKETRALDRVIAATDWGLQRPAGPAVKERRGGGECLILKTLGKLDHLCVPGESPASSRGQCEQVSLEMRCYGPDRSFFEVHSLLGGYDEEGRPVGPVESNTRTVERILASLAFK